MHELANVNKIGNTLVATFQFSTTCEEKKEGMYNNLINNFEVLQKCLKCTRKSPQSGRNEGKRGVMH